MKIYIVFGETGEYSDHRSWVVCAHSSQEKAEAMVDGLGIRYRELLAGRDPFHIHYSDKRAVEEAMQPSDPTFSMDYTGTTWRVEETELTQ